MFFGRGMIEKGGCRHILMSFLTDCDVFKQLNSKQALRNGT